MKKLMIVAMVMLTVSFLSSDLSAKNKILFGSKKGEEVLTPVDRTELKFDEQISILSSMKKSVEETNTQLLQSSVKMNKLLEEMIALQREQNNLFKQLIESRKKKQEEKK